VFGARVGGAWWALGLEFVGCAVGFGGVCDL